MATTSEPSLPVGSSDLHLAAHLFRPPRLTLARELRGITKAELADKIGKSPAAVGQFEGGGRAACRPDAKTVGALALALGVSVAFFTRTTPSKPLDMDCCHFRSLRSASQKERRKLLARGSLVCDLAAFLEEHVELPAEHLSSVARSPRSMEDIEQLALQVRQAWGLGIGPIGNVVRLLESRGVLVTHIPHGCEEVDAFSTWHEARPVVFLVMEKGSTSRTRFDACHELGHLVMHADVSPGNHELEREANRFGSAFLLPRESFSLECPRWLNWDHFYELKRRWKVSVQALVRRAYDLSILSEASYRRAYMHLNKTGERKHERDEPPPEAPTMMRDSVQAVLPVEGMAAITARLGLSEADLRELVGMNGLTD